jgi:threonine synthase
MARLTCRRCGHHAALGFHVNGCPECLGNGQRGIYEVTYDYDAAAQEDLRRALRRSRDHSMWRFEGLLPAGSRDVDVVTLGEGGTPLVHAGWLPASNRLGRLFLKNETANPTWCSKDRGNAVSATMGRLLGAAGMVDDRLPGRGRGAACARDA